MEPNKFEKAAMDAALKEHREQNDFLYKSWRCVSADVTLAFSDNMVFCVGVDPERGQILIYRQDNGFSWSFRFSKVAFSDDLSRKLSIRENYITRTGAELNAIFRGAGSGGN